MSRNIDDDDLQREIQSHLDFETEDQIEAGRQPDDARAAARRKFGSVALARECTRDATGSPGLDALAQDIRFALRALRKNRGFAAAAILTIAVGVGAGTSIFSVCNAVLLKPLPYAEPDRLVMIWEKDRTSGRMWGITPADFADWQTQVSAFSQIAAVHTWSFNLSSGGEPERLSAAMVSTNFFSLLGVRIAPGRDFLPEEGRYGHSRAAILSHGLWQRRFGSDPRVAGRTIDLSGEGYTVVGVLPAEFRFIGKRSDYDGRGQFDVWVPLTYDPAILPKLRGTHPLRVFGRLKPGLSFAQAEADLDLVARNLERLHPDSNKDRGTWIVPLAERVVGDTRKGLYVLLGAVGLLLAIACANVASLMLGRAAARRRELAIRAALGASRFRLVRQLMTEAVVIALAGGALGLSAAWWSTRALAAIPPRDLPRAGEIGMDWRVLAFSFGVSLLAGVVFGLAPALQARNVSAHDTLKDSGRVTAGGQARLRAALSVGQVAIAFVLLAGAGLLIRSVRMLWRVPPGFRAEHVLTARLSLPALRYRNNRQASGFYRELLVRVRALPGVISAGAAAYLPFSGTDNSWGLQIEGRHLGKDSNNVKYRPVTAGYFETMGIPLLAGRMPVAADGPDAPQVAVINDAMARAFFSGEDPIGKHLRILDPGMGWRTIIGVVGDVRHEGLDKASKVELYLPDSQTPFPSREMTVVVRASNDPTMLAGALRREVAALDPTQPVYDVSTMEQLLAASVEQPRFRALLLGAFAAAALLMACIGIYGVMAYQVARRTRELGIRLALGATSGGVLRMIAGRAAVLALAGIAIGLGGALAAARIMNGLLYGITAFDPVTFAAVGSVLFTVAVAAGYAPARRAARVDPAIALRCE